MQLANRGLDSMACRTRWHFRTRGAWIHACDTTVQYRFVSHCCDVILLCIVSQISNKSKYYVDQDIKTMMMKYTCAQQQTWLVKTKQQRQASPWQQYHHTSTRMDMSTSLLPTAVPEFDADPQTSVLRRQNVPFAVKGCMFFCDFLFQLGTVHQNAPGHAVLRQKF